MLMHNVHQAAGRRHPGQESLHMAGSKGIPRSGKRNSNNLQRAPYRGLQYNETVKGRIQVDAFTNIKSKIDEAILRKQATEKRNKKES